MERYFNTHYNYEDMNLWDLNTWADRRSPLEPLLTELIKLGAEGEPLKEYFPDRHDEVQPSTSRSAYFDDVVSEWEQNGMHFICAGMVGLCMLPVSVYERKKLDPKIILIPEYVKTQDNPHWAMNLLEKHRELLLHCAKEEIMVTFYARDSVSAAQPLVEWGLETEGLFRITMEPIYVDLSHLKNAGKELRDVPNLKWQEYGEITEIAGISVVEITDKWQAKMAHQAMINEMYIAQAPQTGYNNDMHIHSTAGRIQAESMRLELDYNHPEEQALLDRWDKLGLKYEAHHTDKGYWVTMTPKCVFDKPEHKIPVLMIMKEPRNSIPFMMQTAMQFYYPFIDIAANGEYMILFFALEKPDDNDVLVDILHDAAKQYPIDLERVYITGQSHNGYYSLEFARRHPDVVTAIATLCDPIGLTVGALVEYDDSIIDSFRSFDMPLININGQLENKLVSTEKGTQAHRNEAHCYWRRLKAWNCKEYTEDEIMAARDSEDYVTRTNGIPSDRTDVRYIMGTEVYVSDLQNNSGKWHLRFATIENTPHMIMPQMGELAWSFLRRFKRDAETHEIIELY